MTTIFSFAFIAPFLSIEFNAEGGGCGLDALRREVSDFLAMGIVKPTPVAKASIAPVYLLGDVLLWIVGFAVVDIDYALAHGSVPFPIPCLPVESAERRFNAVNDYLLNICPYRSACLSTWLAMVELQGAITFATGILPQSPIGIAEVFFFEPIQPVVWYAREIKCVHGSILSAVNEGDFVVWILNNKSYLQLKVVKVPRRSGAALVSCRNGSA